MRTAGPWFVSAMDGREIASGGLRVDCQDGEAIAKVWGHNAEAICNARLIAAAPDGHGLIERLEESFTADGTYQQFLPAMRSYLAKAKGA